MKTHVRLFSSIAGLLLAVSALNAGEPASPPKEPKKDLRNLSSPEPRRRMMVQHPGPRPHEVEKETVAFLGVETSPVNPTLNAQLGLQKGTGLVVNQVIAGSPADGALREHDILLKLEDQILIETRQLAVLVRNRKEGDEVALTYLRGGKEATARIKLGKHEVPKLGQLGTRFEILGPDAGNFRYATPMPHANQEEVDRLLGMIQRAPRGEPSHIIVDRKIAPGFRAMSINTGNSNLVFSDDDGSLELTMKDGVKSLVAKDAAGKPLFSGPVTTPEERKAVPVGVRERLERMEGMHDITFHTDGSFQGAETKIVRPLGRGILLPHRRPAPAPHSSPF